jgi:homoaconitate hydratase
VIAASFSETYKRNAFNNGFVVFECPGLVAALRSAGGIGSSAQVGATGSEGATVNGASGDLPRPKSLLIGPIEIDYQRSTLTVNGASFPFPPLSPVAQELVVAGGAEEVVRRRLSAAR